MTKQEWIITLRNVASDLEAYAARMEYDSDDEIPELIYDAKDACRYIRDEIPHL